MTRNYKDVSGVRKNRNGKNRRNNRRIEKAFRVTKYAEAEDGLADFEDEEFEVYFELMDYGDYEEFEIEYEYFHGDQNETNSRGPLLGTLLLGDAY